MNYLCFYKGLLLDETTDLDDIVESLGKLKKGLIEDPRPYIKLQEMGVFKSVKILFAGLSILDVSHLILHTCRILYVIKKEQCFLMAMT